MMTEEHAIAFGKRAVDAGFRSMPGMYDRYGWRVLRVSAASGNVLRVDTGDFGKIIWRQGNADVIPDFRDPATLGILRQQVIDLVPGAVDLWLIPVPQEMRCLMAWQDSAGERLKESTYFAPDSWHIVALVAALEAHRRQSASPTSEG